MLYLNLPFIKKEVFLFLIMFNNNLVLIKIKKIYLRGLVWKII
jgi:hypothetical protein